MQNKNKVELHFKLVPYLHLSFACVIFWLTNLSTSFHLVLKLKYIVAVVIIHLFLYQLREHHRILLYNRLCQGNQRSSEAQNLQDLIENVDLCVP